MNNELELNKSYTVEFLLEFLLLNRNTNTLLASINNINLLSEPRNQKYVVYDVHTVFLHKFGDKGSYIINSNDAPKIYYIKQK